MSSAFSADLDSERKTIYYVMMHLNRETTSSQIQLLQGLVICVASREWNEVVLSYRLRWKGLEKPSSFNLVRRIWWAFKWIYPIKLLVGVMLGRGLILSIFEFLRKTYLTKAEKLQRVKTTSIFPQLWNTSKHQNHRLRPWHSRVFFWW